MLSIHMPRVKNIAPLATALFCCFFSFSGCTYRLTNLHIQNPDDIQSIAIESVFDTGAEVFPHELLWDQLQRAFAANGHLKVVSAKTADALLRAHVKTVTSVKSGNQITRTDSNTSRKDPDFFASSEKPEPVNIKPPSGSYGPLRDLTTASTLYEKDTTNFVVDIEVWNLESRKLMLQRSYSGSAESIAIVPKSEDFSLIRHDETQDRRITTVARQIAETVVTDLLVR